MDVSEPVERVSGASQSKRGATATATPTRDVDPLSVTKRLQRDGLWEEVEPVRDRLIKECRKKGMSKPDAQAWTYSELDRLYPPLEDEWTTGPDYQLESAEGGKVSGLSDIPASWGELPANASLASEISWCQANRLWIVEEKLDGSTVVHLDRAQVPAPSWAALSWLEASIRVYTKFVDVAAKVTATQQLEQDRVRRERLEIEEIRGLLAEMRSQASK